MANKPSFSDWVNHWWQKFAAMEVGTAYEVSKCAKDSELFLEICSDFINKSPNGSDFTISDDYKFFNRKRKNYPFVAYHKMKEPPIGLRIEKINEGFTEYITIKGIHHKLVHRAERGKEYIPSYRVYDGDRLIAIET